MHNKLVFTLLLLLAMSGSPKAQQGDIKFEHLSLEHGLSQLSVGSIVQDRQGFMWFGTEEGLNKYDGYGFTVYKHHPKDPNSLSSSNINLIYMDSAGTLWVGTIGGGLNEYDPKSRQFTVYRNDPKNPASLSNNEVRAIYEDTKGILWVGTSRGLNRFDLKSRRFTPFKRDPNSPTSLGSENIRGICEDNEGMLWIGTRENGLRRYDPKSGQVTLFSNDPNSPASLSSNEVRVISKDRSGAIWIGTKGGGLNRYDPKSGQFDIYRNDPRDHASLNNNDIRAIYEDSRGTLWIGTLGGGLNRYDPKTRQFTAYRNNPSDSGSISNNWIISIYEDNSGILWMGTFGSGISRYDPKSRRFITHHFFDRNSADIKSIYEDSRGMLWVGSRSGLNRFDTEKGTVTSYRHEPNNPNSISGDYIEAILEDRSGTVWIGTNDGLNRYDPKNQSFTVYHHDPNNPNSISSDSIRAIYEDSAGMLWIGTQEGGLTRYDQKSNTFTIYRNEPNNPGSISHNTIWVIYEDSNGTLWFGTEAGLNRYDPNSRSFVSYRNDLQDPSSLSNNSVTAIHQDRQGTLWVGTYGGGLNRFDPVSHSFIAFTEKEGLSNDVVYGMLEDSEGNFWMSTNKGISKFNPVTRGFKNYDASDGLQSNEFNLGAFHKSRSGEMFFGGINGYNRFYPEMIKDNPFIPPVAITSFKILDTVTNKESLVMALSAGLTEKLPLELSYRENVLSFEFAALNFTHPEKNQYEYILEGSDKGWIKSGKQRYVRYTNLYPGEYVFRVKGSNNDGMWNEEATTVRIRITPPPWSTWWAYILYLVGLTGAGYGGYRYRIKTIERRHLLERAVEIKIKNEELESKNEELVQKNEELVESHKRADRIFSVLAKALPGTVLDNKYHLEEKIGSGGFGVVYKATNLTIKRPIAVKVFKPSPGNDSGEALERFRLEAISACRINHPNAVEVLDSGISTEGIAYLIMELLQGHTLAVELKQRGTISIKRTAQILIPVCDVLSKAHSMGIVHRDIKPDNIFLHRGEKGGVVKVVDFGIAKLMEVSASMDIRDLTAVGRILGTPAYIAPERFEGESYDGQADIYSLGVMLYEMLCGKLPFQSEAKGLLGLAKMYLQRDPIPLRELNPQIPEAIEALVIRTLEKDPNRRPTAKELGEKFLSAAGIGPEMLSFQVTSESNLSLSITDEDATTLKDQRLEFKE